MALFTPVFFGVAGLSINLRVLGDPHLLALALLLIVMASVGKLVGCYLGSRVARRNHQEALAVGIAMNARGSTEVILATIGLGMGVLNQQLFTLIVVMAVVTTLTMPPMLRWALARVPVSEDERARLDIEAAELHDLIPKFERVLVGLDSSANGRLASRLAGWLVGARQLTSTIIEIDSSAKGGGQASVGSDRVVAAAESATRVGLAADHARTSEPAGEHRDAIAVAAEEAQAERIPVKDLVSIRPSVEQDESMPDSTAAVILAETRNGYDFLILGLDEQTEQSSGKLPPAVETIVREYAGPVAILLHCTDLNAADDRPLDKILVPTKGADYSRFGAEVAIAIAKGCGATITALHVSAPPTANELLRRPNQLRRPGRFLLADIVALGQREGVRVSTKSVVGSAKHPAIMRQTTLGGHQLIVLGTKARAGDQLHFGSSVAALLAEAPCPILIVKS